MTREKITKNFIITTFVALYAMVSIISTIHVIEFFKLSNPEWLAVTLAIAFELGAAASLASIIAMEKMNKAIVWILFFTLTAMQAMGNTYYAFVHVQNYQTWSELFGMVDSEIIEQKRVLALISGAILPLVALGFIKSLVDYIRPEKPILEIRDMVSEPAIPAELKPLPIPEDIFMVNYGEQTQTDISKLDDPVKASDEDLVRMGQEAQHRLIMKKVAEKHQERLDKGETFEDEPTALANSGLTERIVEENPEPEPVEVAEVEQAQPLPENIVVEEEPTPTEEINVEEEQPKEFLDKIKVFKDGEAK